MAESDPGEAAGKARRVALLGGAGFVGRELARRLAARGDVVRIGSRAPRRHAAIAPAGAGRIEFVEACVDDEAALDRLFEGADAAVNLVSIMTADVRALYHVNVDGARLAALRAKRAGVASYAHVSAIGASPASPAAYGRSKAAAEQAVRDAFGEASILRPSIVFGAEDHFFNMFALMAAFSPVLPVFGARTRFQPVFVGDVAEALIRLLEPRNAAGEEGRLVEAGGPDVLTMRELMALVLEVTRRRRLLLPVPGFATRLFMTRDQAALMRVDNVVAPGADTLAGLGLSATPLRTVLPEYLRAGIPVLIRRLRTK